VADLEAGKTTLELGLVLKALRALGARVDVRASEASPLPGVAGEPRSAPAPRIDLEAIMDSEDERG
jgi:hypothetical protein